MFISYLSEKSQRPEGLSGFCVRPSNTIYLVMRLYWPKTEAPSILPAGEGTWKPPGIVKVK
jgi:hypothetical protein